MADYSIKLTESKVTTLRLEYWTRGTKQIDLASRYNISPSQVSQIVRRKSWPYLPKVKNEFSSRG